MIWGIEAIIAPDMISEYCVPWVPWKFAIPTVIVYLMVSLMIINGQRKSFHALINDRITTVAIADWPRGRMILMKILNLDAPSMNAASSNSVGMPS